MRPFLTRTLLITAVLLAMAVRSAAAAPEHGKVVEAAVNLTALQPGQQAVAAVELEIADGFHAQSHTPSQPTFIKFKINLDADPALNFYDPVYPAGEDKTYGDLGTLNVYTGRVTIFIPLEVAATAPLGPLKLKGKLRYQVCDDHVCYAPSATPFEIDTQIVAAGQQVQPWKPDLFQSFDAKVFSRLHKTRPAATQPVATQPATTQPGGALPGAGNDGGFRIFGRDLTSNSYGLAFIAAFLVGIVFNAVPCVLPVLPLKAIGFYEVSQHSRTKSLALGAIFSAGLIASFGVLALLVVVFRVLAWGELYSNVWFTLGIVTILVVMAISTFGFFTVNLPPAIYNITPRHDTYVGNFLFGILTAVLSTPCTFGMFLGLLVWATRQPAVIGTAMVMTVGAGMASPYFVLSAFPELARRFPRTGPWSELVKQMMGFLLLGTALYFARRFLAPLTGIDGFWWVLFALVVLAAGFMLRRAFQLSPRQTPRLIAGTIAALMIVPALVVTLSLARQPYSWKPYSPEALAAARKDHRVAVVEFTATWCGNCQYLESFVLHDKTIVAEVRNDDVEMLKADLTADDAPGWPLLKQLNPIAAIPFTAVYSPAREQPMRLTGIYSTADLRDAIKQASSTALALR